MVNLLKPLVEKMNKLIQNFSREKLEESIKNARSFLKNPQQQEKNAFNKLISILNTSEGGKKSVTLKIDFSSANFY